MPWPSTTSGRPGILLLVFRSVRIGLICLAPKFVPAAMAFGVRGYLSGTIGLGASVVTAIAIGIIVDDTIHFLAKYLDGRRGGLSAPDSVRATFKTVGPALWATTAIPAAGFLVFSSSGYEPSFVLGTLVAITISFALIADLLLLPALLMAIDRKQPAISDARNNGSAERKKVVVIGADAAGLSAAWTLKKHGIDAILLEANPRVGGHLGGDRVGGFPWTKARISSAIPTMSPSGWARACATPRRRHKKTVTTCVTRSLGHGPRHTGRVGDEVLRHRVSTLPSAIDRRRRSEPMRTTRMASIDFAAPIGDGGRHGHGMGLRCQALPGVRTAIAAAAVLVSSGCASTATLSGDPNDSWESTNRTFYAFNEALDQAVLEPVAHLYLRLPSGLRDSVHNFFDNAAYPGTVLNQLLQGKLEPAMEGSARFVFNTTLGIGGLFDVATGFGLEREEEDFGQTLAVWGVEEGNYIHWPVLGPSSVRDTPGLVVGALTDVLTYIAVFPAALLELVDTRANLESALRTCDEAAFDPYVFTREAYRQRRTFLIHDGNPPPRGPGEDTDDG